MTDADYENDSKNNNCKEDDDYINYVDCPNKKEKKIHYERRIEKLDKHYFFISKDIYKLRKRSSHKRLLKAFSRIAMKLNEKSPACIPIDCLDHVCLVLINDYRKDKFNDLKTTPLNDGYLFASTQFHMDYKIFYLYNCNVEDFSAFLSFFMKNTQKNLTVFYSGRTADGNQGIMFPKGILSRDAIADIMASNCNGKAHYVFINDSPTGGTNFDITLALKQNKPIKNFLSFGVDKSKTPGYKEAKRTHGLLTFYICKAVDENPIINPNDLIEKMNTELRRFKLKFECAITDQELANSPIFYNDFK